MADQQSAKLSQPCVGAFDDPSALVAAQFPAIFVPLRLVVLSVRRNEFDAAPLPSLAQRIGVIAAIRDHTLRLLARTAFRPGDADLGERGVRKRNFCRRGTLQPNSQRNTLTVSQYHPLCALAALGFSDRIAPFLAGAKLPSRKASSHFSRPSASRAPRSARQALSHTPFSSHCLSRRQQVGGEGYSSGRNRHAAPVCSTHRMPSKQARFEAQGRPRLSRLRGGSGNNGPTNSHCSSVNSFCRFFMTEEQHLNRLIRK